MTITPTKGKTAPWTSPKIVESCEPLRIPKVSFYRALRPVENLDYQPNFQGEKAYRPSCMRRLFIHDKTIDYCFPRLAMQTPLILNRNCLGESFTELLCHRQAASLVAPEARGQQYTRMSTASAQSGNACQEWARWFEKAICR